MPIRDGYATSWLKTGSCSCVGISVRVLARIGPYSMAKSSVVPPNSTVHRTRANRSARR